MLVVSSADLLSLPRMPYDGQPIIKLLLELIHNLT